MRAKIKSALRDLCVGISRLSKRSDRLLILYYHSIDERRGVKFYLKTPPEVFVEQIKILKDNYNVVSLGKLIMQIKRKKRLDKSIVITFDDGFKDNYTTAYPILYKLDLPATFFITTGFVNKRGYMDWKDLKELKESGFEIGSHTVTHPRLSELPRYKIDEELRISKETLEMRLDEEIKLFAAPYGDSKSVNDDVIELAKRYYECCCLTQGYFGIDPSNVDLYRLKRTPAMPDVYEFKLTIDGYAGLWLWLYEKLIILKNEKLKLTKI